MFHTKSLFDAARTWQQAGTAYGRMLMTAQQVIAVRSMQMALGTMKPEEATRMVLEKPAAFAKAFEMAARSQAASRGTAAAALAAIKPIGAKTAANARRLGKTKTR
ncbi:MAG: hypothetical protein KDA73_02980 [Rhodobacteraceae bacterium]|nr:hypothetical protein [Paracoccaceae bacterium]